MTNEYTYFMRDGAPNGSPGRYDRTSILQYLKSSDPGAVTEAGDAYLRFAAAYEKLTPKLAQIGHDLNDAWNGTDAAAAQEQLRNLWASSHTIGAASKDFGTAVERHGSEYLAWYKNNMPQPKDDAEARSWMQGANERITETWSAIPPSISTTLDMWRLGHGAPIRTPPSGGYGGSGVPGSGGSEGAGAGGSGGLHGSAPGSSSNGPAGSGSPGAVSPTPGLDIPGNPSGHVTPPGQAHPGAQPGSMPSSPGVGHPVNPGTDLSGVHPPGTGDPNGSGPGLPAGPASPSTSPLAPTAGSQWPGAGTIYPGMPGGTGPAPLRGGTGLPAGGAIGVPRGGNALGVGEGPSIGGPNGNGAVGNGRFRNGVIGRDTISPATAAQAETLQESAAARSGPAAMGPMTGAGGSAQRNRERDRQSWAGEPPDLWDDDSEVSPSVLGAADKRPVEGT
ncbi:hypothetical protein [Actinomadura verrucosospora]|uniref:Triple helix repeat-containing collagen n=1 Tax=Actinomadura verrucosospora TaxID=46165 RepID=A0A7D3VXW9_ACTVE|nr:hypothetical protein [Actinomadura verrucosospora]QKG25350.1 triple helix repeat-containing collagen [Actinomadura verrucosospora]